MTKYEVIIYWSNEDEAYIADVPELPGCAAHGGSQEEALRNAQDAIGLWLDTAVGSLENRHAGGTRGALVLGPDRRGPARRGGDERYGPERVSRRIPHALPFRGGGSR